MLRRCVERECCECETANWFLSGGIEMVVERVLDSCMSRVSMCEGCYHLVSPEVWLHHCGKVLLSSSHVQLGT